VGAAAHSSQENPMNDLDPIVTTNKKSFHLLEIVVAATFKSAMYVRVFIIINYTTEIITSTFPSR